MRKNVLYLVAAALFALSARAEDLQYLDHSEIALARLYNDISNAESTIDLSYFIWDPCSSVAKVLMHQLQMKARPSDRSKKPVRVRMLLDSFYQRKDLEAIQDYFNQSGIELKFYNGAEPLANAHTHSKMCLVDKNVPGKSRLVTGGRNIADAYFGMDKHNYVDRDVAVGGLSAPENTKGVMAQAEGGFERLWANRKSVAVGRPSQSQSARLAACTKWTPKDYQLDRYLRQNAARIIAGEKPVTCPNVGFTMDDMLHTGYPMNERALHKPTSQAVLRLLSQTNHTLTMENQYFIPDETYFKPWLHNRKANHVRVDLYSNMFEKQEGFETLLDQDNFEIVSLWQREEMRRETGNGETNHMNFRIAGIMDRWAFSPPVTGYSYHAKTYVADSQNAIVSSFNIDPRSMNINGESALSVRSCPAFAQKVENMAKLTGKVWDLEEHLQTCLTGYVAQPPLHDPITHIVEWFSHDLQ